MLRKIRVRMTYANVTGTLALFIALGGTSAYAVNEWNGSNIQDGTLTGADIQDLSLGLPDYGANSISTGKLKDGDVRTQDLRDLGVTNPKIAWDSVSSGKVLNNNLTGDDVNEGTLELPIDYKVKSGFGFITVQCDTGMRAVGGGARTVLGRSVRVSHPVDADGNLPQPDETATGWGAQTDSNYFVDTSVLCVP
jgi:hypothetical protein